MLSDSGTETWTEVHVDGEIRMGSGAQRQTPDWYGEWMSEPKTEEWLAEGKARNWEYQNC
jgi:hypothetical protein